MQVSPDKIKTQKILKKADVSTKKLKLKQLF